MSQNNDSMQISKHEFPVPVAESVKRMQRMESLHRVSRPIICAHICQKNYNITIRCFFLVSIPVNNPSSHMRGTHSP